MKKCSALRAAQGPALESKPFFNDIVLIEHDESLRARLSHILNGYCRTLFSFGALTPASLHLQHQQLPSVVVTDLYLPDGRSIDLIESCLNRSHVIVISNQATQEEAFLLGRMGVKGYLKKPVDIRRLNLVIEQSLNESAGENKLTINTFGGLSILKNGRELQFNRKTPYRILDFIACILSLGARNVPVATVCDRLWPDAEGDKAERNFTACLRRARDLLGIDGSEVLIRQAGKVSFNAEKVVVDLWCLENVSGISAAGGGYAKEHFVQDWLPEYDRPWLVRPRESFRKMTASF